LLIFGLGDEIWKFCIQFGIKEPKIARGCKENTKLTNHKNKKHLFYISPSLVQRGARLLLLALFCKPREKPTPTLGLRGSNVKKI